MQSDDMIEYINDPKDSIKGFDLKSMLSKVAGNRANM